MPPANDACVVCDLYPFMIVAPYKESPLSVIYFWSRQVPSLINCNNNIAVGNTNLKSKRSTTYMMCKFSDIIRKKINYMLDANLLYVYLCRMHFNKCSPFHFCLLLHS